MGAISYSRPMRDKAKRDKLHLVTLAAFGVELQAPVTGEEADEVLEFMTAFWRRRQERIRAEEQQAKGGAA